VRQRLHRHARYDDARLSHALHNGAVCVRRRDVDHAHDRPGWNHQRLISCDLLLSINKEVPARVVLVEADMFEWHRARYASGLYASAEPDPTLFGSPEIAAELLGRWHRGTPTDL
jgi:hypothetical protein